MPDITVDGEPIRVPKGRSLAAALIESGRPAWRTTRRSAELRGISCGIGVCFDCLVTINGTPGVRACLVDVEDGDQVTTEEGSGYAADAV
jgi:aerobic-type carbon monoxide dehydrogenase small subunit (CoxS/CutS family)